VVWHTGSQKNFADGGAGIGSNANKPEEKNVGVEKRLWGIDMELTGGNCVGGRGKGSNMKLTNRFDAAVSQVAYRGIAASALLVLGGKAGPNTKSLQKGGGPVLNG